MGNHVGRTLSSRLLACLLAVLLLHARESAAQPAAGPQPIDRAHTLVFSTTQPGAKLNLTTWGVDTALPDPNNVVRSQLYMGADQIDVVRVSFPIRTPLVNGELPDSIDEHFATRIAIARLAGEKPWRMLPDSDRGVHPWFKDGKDVNPQRWAQLLAAAQRKYGKTMQGVEPFNEADWGWGQGSAQNLANIIDELRKHPDFKDVKMIGPSTLGTNSALPWYRTLGDRIDHGTTHALGGSFDNYAAFYQQVVKDGRVADNPEVHNLVEVISGAEYGLQCAIWWGNADRARGAFVNAVQGERLAYAEDRERWSSSGVYRAPDGKLQAFLGSSERLGHTTHYRFVVRDRPVFFDGDGPRRDITLRIAQDNERLVNLTWGEDVQPKLGGRYVIVNRATGKVLCVANASKDNGAAIVQSTYDGSKDQQWEIEPLSKRFGDQSYFTVRALHSGRSIDTTDWTHEEGAAIQQWGDGDASPQHWFFDYAGGNDFFIRSRWSAKYLQPKDDVITQTARHDAMEQRWRLIPVEDAGVIEFDAPLPPTDVQAISKPAAVELRWKAVDPGERYVVLRADRPKGPFETIARGVHHGRYVDGDAAPGRAGYYAVRAEDACLNSSARSSVVSGQPTGEPAVVAQYDFALAASDESGNDNHAREEGEAFYEIGPGGAGAIRLAGEGAHLRLPVNIGTVRDFTFAAWVQPQGGDAWQRIFDFGNDETQFIFLTPRSSAGTLRLSTKNGAAERSIEGPGLADGQWSHVAVTLEGKHATLYVNGRAVAATRDWPVAPVDLLTVFNYLGKSQFPVDPTFSGRLSAVRLFNHALSPEAVRELAKR